METVVTEALLARVTASSAKGAGLLQAFDALLGFHDNDFYTAKWPELAGKTFGACVEHFPMAVAIGVVKEDGEVVLMPDNDFVLTAETGIIVIAEDKYSYHATKEPVEVGTSPHPRAFPHELVRPCLGSSRKVLVVRRNGYGV